MNAQRYFTWRVLCKTIGGLVDGEYILFMSEADTCVGRPVSRAESSVQVCAPGTYTANVVNYLLCTFLLLV